MAAEIIDGKGFYYAEVYAPDQADSDGYLDAKAVVRPPIDTSRMQPAIEDFTVEGIEIEEYATTRAVTVLELSYKLKKEGMGGASTASEAFELMMGSMKGLIGRLNEIESGQYPSKGNQ